MANKKYPAEGGNARGHSNMEHSLHTAEIKGSARKARRRADRAEIADQTSPIARKPFRYAVAVQWSEGDAVYVARVPALGIGCAAHGDSLEDAVRDVRVAAELMLDVMAKHGDPIPDPLA